MPSWSNKMPKSKIGKPMTRRVDISQPMTLKKKHLVETPDAEQAVLDKRAKTMESSLKYYDYPLIQTDEECGDRLTEFFAHAVITGERVSYEKMCLALGAIVPMVRKWEMGIGCSQVRAWMVLRAKTLLQSITADGVMDKDMPENTYMFRAKNFFDMADKSEIIVSPKNFDEDIIDADELRAKYMESIPDADD